MSATPPTPPPTPSPRLRFTFGRAQKLKGKTQIDEVYKQGRKRVAHPLLAYALRRSDNGPARLGISVARRCGNAVVRNRIKRHLREAFRLMQHDLPPGVDYLVVVKPHRDMKTGAYQGILRTLLT